MNYLAQSSKLLESLTVKINLPAFSAFANRTMRQQVQPSRLGFQILILLDSIFLNTSMAVPIECNEDTSGILFKSD